MAVKQPLNDGDKLRAMGLARAKRSFRTVFTDPNEATMRGVGLMLADALDNREAVLRAAAEALEDMNFHTDAATLREMASLSPVSDHIDVMG